MFGKIVKFIFSILFLYGIFLMLLKAAQAMGAKNTPQDIANVCALETHLSNTEACHDGFNSSLSLIMNLIKDGGIKDCGTQFPNFDQLNPVCKKYYSNSSLTGSCLNGLTSGATEKLTLVAVDCANTTKDNVVAAMGALAVTGAALFYHHTASKKPVQQFSNKIFCIPEEENTNAEEQKLSIQCK
jgi:hypothetical protein